MSYLKLSPGHKIKIGLTFETPEEEYIALGASEDAKAAIAGPKRATYDARPAKHGRQRWRIPRC